MSSAEHPIHWHLAPQNSPCFPGVHFSHAVHHRASDNWGNYYSFDQADVTCLACIERLAAHVEKVMEHPVLKDGVCAYCHGSGYASNRGDVCPICGDAGGGVNW